MYVQTGEDGANEIDFTFVRFAEIGMHVEQARSGMLIGSMVGRACLLLTNQLSVVRQTPSQMPINTHTLQWRPTLHFTQATAREPQKEKVGMGE